MKKLDLKSLKKVALEQSAPLEKTIVFNLNGEDFEGQVWVKMLSFKDQNEIIKAYEWEFDKDDISKSRIKSIDSRRLQAAQVLGSICEDDKGTPFFDNVEQVLDSNPSLINAMYAAADEVNNFLGKSQKTNSEKTSSGANLSSTESAAKPSQKQKKISQVESSPSGESTAADAEASTQVAE